MMNHDVKSTIKHISNSKLDSQNDIQSLKEAIEKKDKYIERLEEINHTLEMSAKLNECEEEGWKNQINLLQKELEKANEEIQILEQKVFFLSTEYNEINSACQNLKNENVRMTLKIREKSNKDHSLYPKEQRCGYILIEMKQVYFTLYQNQGFEKMPVLIKGWEYVFETFYTYSTQPIADWVFQHMKEDFFPLLGLDVADDNEKTEIANLYPDLNNNAIVDVGLNLNCRTGYWKVHIKTLFEISAEILEDTLNFKPAK